MKTLRSFLPFVAFTAFVAGCTFLVSFDDAPDSGAAPGDDDTTSSSSSGKHPSSSSSSSGDESSSSSSSSSSSGGVDAGPTMPPPCDPAANLDETSCSNFVRPECGDEPNVDGPQVADTDLVDCNAASTPTCVRHCPHGCNQFPTGFPDQCDACFTKPNGTYCSKDLAGTNAANAIFSITCSDGVLVAKEKCATACATACPDGTSTPSCCQ